MPNYRNLITGQIKYRSETAVKNTPAVVHENKRLKYGGWVPDNSKSIDEKSKAAIKAEAAKARKAAKAAELKAKKEAEALAAQSQETE